MKYGKDDALCLAQLGPCGQCRTRATPEPLLTLPYGVPALKRVYGVVFQRIVPLPAGGTVTQTALRDGTIGAANIFSTDPSITKYSFVPLTDTKHIFAAQNVVPLFNRNMLTQPMAQACNAASARLTTAMAQQEAGVSRFDCRGDGYPDRPADLLGGSAIGQNACPRTPVPPVTSKRMVAPFL